MTATYTEKQLKAMTKKQLQAIADTLEISFNLEETKPKLIEWIVFAQDQVARHEEAIDPTPETTSDSPAENLPKDSISEIDSEVEILFNSAEYEEKLVLYLDQRTNLKDTEAEYLLKYFSEFKQSIAPITKRSRPSTPKAPRVTDPAAKLAQAKEVWDKVQELGSPKSAAEALGKSAHYTKVIAQAYDLYDKSKKVRAAYDNGQIGWTQLYDFAFRSKKTDSIATVEAKLKAQLAELTISPGDTLEPVVTVMLADED